jgi:multicomponent Na+:H+ antiporter subunit D
LWFAQKRVQVVDNVVGEIYRLGGLLPLKATAFLVGLFDNYVIDGIVDGVAAGVRGVGNRLRTAQRGALQESLTLAFAAVVILVIAFIFFF